MTSTRPEDPAFEWSMLDFLNTEGRGIEDRSMPFHTWASLRREHGVWPFERVLQGRAGHQVMIADEGRVNHEPCINFGSQDYLGLAQSEDLKDAVRAVLEPFGVHSAGSPALCGRTRLLVDLEDKFSRLLRREACIIFPTGWGAGFGAVAGLAREDDCVLLDALSHNCLQEGARHATAKVRRFRHNSLENLARLLGEERARNGRNGLFLVIESLYSMDSDSPDLPAMVRLAREHGAFVIMDCAHDLGAMGSKGLGLLETVEGGDGPDVIVGSFSKTFGANGGFVACSRAVRHYLAFFANPYVFSNAISPLQTAVVSCAFDLIYSSVGDQLRERLQTNVLRLRGAMGARGLRLSGSPSPIVPVFVGDERIARLTAKHLVQQGLLANLVEFPAVAKGTARFRFQVMASHGPEAIDRAAEIMAHCKSQAEAEWSSRQHRPLREASPPVGP